MFITHLYHSLIKCLLVHFVSVSLVLSSPFPWGIYVLFQLIFIHIVGHSKAQAVSHRTLWGPCVARPCGILFGQSGNGTSFSL